MKYYKKALTSPNPNNDKHNIIYILLYLLLLGIVGYVLLNEGKVPIHRKMNTYVGNMFIDQFLAYATHLGDGLFAFLISFINSFYLKDFLS